VLRQPEWRGTQPEQPATKRNERLTVSESREVAFPIGFGFGLDTGVDGKKWPTMTVAANFAQFTVMFPVDMAKQMMVSLPKALEEIVKQAEAENGDTLVVAPASSLDILKGTRHGK
jgi:hypothetical protein